MLRLSLHRLNLSKAPRVSSSVKLLGAPSQQIQARPYKTITNTSSSLWNQSDKSLLLSSDNVHVMTNNKNSLKLAAGQRRHANTSAGNYAPASSVRAVPFDRHQHNEQKFSCAQDEEDSSHNYGNNLSEQQLPSLPVADLEQTMEKLKESLAPFAMNSHEYAETLNLIDEFQSSAGVKLSLLLNEKAKKTSNWMSHDWWQHESYLRCRGSLMINSNPAMIYPKLPTNVGGRENVNKFLASLISAFMDCREALRTGTNLEASTTKQCLDQYTKIFGSTRIPSMGGVDDMHIKDVSQSLETFSIVIAHKNRFYQLNLSNTNTSDAQRLDAIKSALEIIEANASSHDGQSGIARPIGILTSLPRDDWAQVYPLLDGETLLAIDEAQFVFCLDSVKDEHRVQSFLDDHTHQQVLGKQILNADDENIGNRWFDKTLQLIVVVDDNVERLLGAGINYEHTVAEATPISKIIEYTYDKVASSIPSGQEKMVTNLLTQTNTIQPVPLTGESSLPNDNSTIRQLSMFDVSNYANIDAKLHEAKQHYDISAGRLDLEVLNFTHYGKNAIKSWKFSPDSWVQVALSLAYYNLHGRLGSCYESVSLRKFAFGRTETMRSLTQEVAQFCMQPNFDRLRQAITAHNYLARAASNGRGIDRVLLGYRLAFNEVLSGQWKWGLSLDPSYTGGQSFQNTSKEAFDSSCIFSEDDIRVVKLFMKNKLIQRSKRFVLSTSQVNSVYPNTFLTYGPLVPEGYGCCYNPTNDQIVVAITADTSSNPSIDCSPTKYKAILEESLILMQDLLNQNYISNSKL